MTLIMRRRGLGLIIYRKSFLLKKLENRQMERLLTVNSVSKEGTEAAEWDRVTWYELQDLATNHLEAGVCFRSL